jgi:hypothetical protein
MRRLPKIPAPGIFALLLGFFAFSASATTYYVNLNNPSPASPYTNWSMASTSIQSAVSLAANGDLVLVTNGFYHNEPIHPYIDTSNQNAQIIARVGISSGVTVSSVNGPAFTLIQGYPFTCVFLAANATLSGFTLTNGIANESSSPPLGGGAYCQTTNALISNCLICSNSAPSGSGGGVFSGTLNNCILSNNFAEYFGGGSFQSVLNHCTLIGNTVFTFEGSGAFGGMLNDCVLISNTASGEVSEAYGGAACSNVLNNCLIIGNAATFDQPTAAIGSLLTNCTIAENRYYPDSDEVPVVRGCVLRNCILYYNGYDGFGGSGIYDGSDLKNCCAEPAFTFHGGSNNNFTNAPLFVNTNGDFHLQPNSPCINAGNNGFVSSTTDLDGNPRIVGGTVDIGAYEYQTPTSVISYAYLQQYGLPTDGSVDYADLDGTAFNVYQDWVTGLNPTNNASILAMFTPATTNNANGLTVTWQSVTNILYNLQRSTNLPAFTTIQSNITGQAGATSYTDISATNNVPYFYRVGVLAP